MLNAQALRTPPFAQPPSEPHKLHASCHLQNFRSGCMEDLRAAVISGAAVGKGKALQGFHGDY